MRRLVVAFPATLVLACAGVEPVPRTEVAVAPPPVGETAAAPPACTIAGDGELRYAAAARAPFVVHQAKTGETPVAIVVMSDLVAVKWSELPAVAATAEGTARAHVMLGGGSTPSLKLGGWTSLVGRAFQTRGEAVVEPDHVWLVAGTDVSVRGMLGGAVAVRRERSGLADPDVVDATAACGDVVFQRDRVDPPAAPPVAPANLQARGAAIDLRGKPGGPRLRRLALSEGSRFPLTELGREPGAVHVAGFIGVLRFDGWIRDDEVEPLGSGGHGRLGGSHQTRPPSIRGGQAMVVIRETPLYLGDDAESARPIGVLEVGARLDVFGHGARSNFAFSPVVFQAPDGLRFFVDEGDLRPP